MDANNITSWRPGTAPVAVIMISLNEGHNMEEVCQNLAGWAHEVFLVDSYSQDETVDIALSYGVHVIQRQFIDFGDQWNFALRELPITAPWTMKLDPDERLSDELKNSIENISNRTDVDGLSISRKLWFMGKALPIDQRMVRLWKTGKCTFTDVSVNEHPIVKGRIKDISGDLQHHDSPDLEHWLEKQNHYTTSEAVIAYEKSKLADTPRLFGSDLQRRMWLKKNFYKLPFRYLLLFLYYWLIKGTWRSGWVGYAWARLRSDVMRLVEFKHKEMVITGRMPRKLSKGPGKPDLRVQQY